LGVTLGSVYLIIMGILWILGGAACAAGGALFAGLGGSSGVEGLPGVFGAAAGLAFFFAIVAIVFAILQIAAGAGALGGRGWARWIGIIMSIILALFLILGGCSAFTANDSTNSGAGSGIVFLVLGVLYVLTAYAFIAASSFFSSRR
jgi:hypothetical protein